MRKTTCGALLLAVLISACGGEGDAVPPPQAPPPPPPAAPPPPVAATPPPAPAEAPKPPLLDLQKQGHTAAFAALNAHDAKKFSEVYAPVATLPSGDAQWHVSKGSADEDKEVEVVKGIYNAFEKKSESDFIGAMADNVTWADLSQPKDMSGKPAAKQFFGMFTKALTDIKQ